MKPVALVIVTVVLSTLAALTVTRFLSEGNDDSALKGAQDSEVQFARLREDLQDMSRRQAVIEEQLSRSIASADSDALRRLRSTVELDLKELRGEMARIAKELEARPAAADRQREAVVNALGSEDAAAALDAYLAEKVEEQLKKSRPSLSRQFAPMIKMNMNRELRRTAQKLDLNEDQTRRLTEASNAAFDKALPAVEIMMDPAAEPAAKEQALADVRQTMDQVSSDAESYMTSEQHQQFLQEQQRQLEGMDRMRAMWSGSGGTTGGATQGSSSRTGGGN